MKLAKTLCMIAALAVTTQLQATNFPYNPPHAYPTYVGTKEQPFDLTHPTQDELILLCKILTMEELYPGKFGNIARYTYIDGVEAQEMWKAATGITRMTTKENALIEWLLEYKYGIPKDEFEKKQLSKLPDNTIPECMASVKNLKYATVDITDIAPTKPYDFEKGGYYFQVAENLNLPLPKTSWKDCGKICTNTEAFVKIPEDKAKQWKDTKNKRVVVFGKVIRGIISTKPSMRIETESVRFLGDNNEIIVEIPASDITRMKAER
jgi:hypothetical protein